MTRGTRVKGTNLLTDVEMKEKPGAKIIKLRDGDGLYFWIMPDGSRYWRLRYWRHNREPLMGLGVYPAVSLADARIAREGQRKLLQGGADPIAARRKAEETEAAERAERKRLPILAAEELETPLARRLERVVDAYHRRRIVGKRRNEKHIKQWRSSLQEVIDALGPSRDVRKIEKDDLVPVLIPVVQRAPETAARVLKRLDEVFGALLFEGGIVSNPVRPSTHR